MSSLKYWLWLSSRGGIGSSRALKLLEHFSTPERVYHARGTAYIEVEGIKHEDIKQLMHKDLGEANKILSSCAVLGCRILTLQDSDYPDRLRNIYDPPLVLYIKGTLPHIDDEAVVGVVGTRNCTPYGVTAAEKVGCKLSRQGIVVVTGLALGVDSAATRGALRGGTRTIGVIGSGLDIVYPPENTSLFDDVARHGAVISEYPPGTPAVKTHFPARNRIISGISLGIAVIEAPKQSGALITASRALEQGRDVFALPGNVDALACEGSNALLREGAIPFITAEDIIDEYIDLYPDKLSQPKENSQKKKTDGSLKKNKQKDEADSESMETKQKNPIDNTSKVDYIDLGILLGELKGDEKAIARSIGNNALHIDEIMSETGLTAQKALAALTMLELGEHVRRDINGKWEIKI